MPRPRRTISRAELTEAQDRFIQAWGQMGSAWGISRTMAEVHALLYISGRPMNTDEVMDRLRISRGNASMTLRSLGEWGIVSRVHKRGDRKEYFEAELEPWSLARQIIRERIRREILPTLATLHEIRDLTREEVEGHAPAGTPAAGPEVLAMSPAPTPQDVAGHNQRLDELLSLVQTIDRLAERFVGSEGQGLKLAASLLSRIV